MNVISVLVKNISVIAVRRHQGLVWAGASCLSKECDNHDNCITVYSPMFVSLSDLLSSRWTCVAVIMNSKSGRIFMISCSFTEGCKYKCNLLGVFLNFGIDIVESHRLCIVCSVFLFYRCLRLERNRLLNARVTPD